MQTGGQLLHGVSVLYITCVEGWVYLPTSPWCVWKATQLPLPLHHVQFTAWLSTYPLTHTHTHTHTHTDIISRLAPVSLTSSGKRRRFSRSLFRRRYALECIPPTGLSFIYGLFLASSGSVYSLFKICYFHVRYFVSMAMGSLY